MCYTFRFTASKIFKFSIQNNKNTMDQEEEKINHDGQIGTISVALIDNNSCKFNSMGKEKS